MIGFVICTFKREVYAKKNVAIIHEYMQQNPDLQGKLDVFVIDNGHTLTQEDVPSATLVYNKNLGGSGGFTRGMIEICNRREYTHVLFSDDDVVYPPSIFRKTITLLETAKNPQVMAVGTAMLRLDRPNLQHEFGAQWNNKAFHARSVNGGFDVSKQTALLRNERISQVDYSAWWYICMPIAKVKECGLPLPFFIKVDDIEYNVRCKFEFALLNGMGAWHEPFQNKYSAYLEYYSVRNQLISHCITNPLRGGKAFRWLITIVAYQLVTQRYFALKYVFQAYNDLLKGAEFLLQTDGAKLNRSLLEKNLKTQTKAQLIEQGYDVQNIYLPKRKRTLAQVISLNGQLIPSCFYNKQSRKYRVVDIRQCYPRQFYKVKRVVQYNPITETGFVTTQKFGQLFRAGFSLVGMGIKMLFRYRRAVKSYRKNYKFLASEENWKKLLELETKETE